MASNWEQQFERRFASLEEHTERPEKSIALSLKLRVTSGCFHREHSPIAYEMIDNAIASATRDGIHLVVEEHESGPEILLWLAVTAGGLSLAKSIVELVTAIIKARNEGIKRGDRDGASLEIIVRGNDLFDAYKEKPILTFDRTSPVDSRQLEHALDAAIRELYGSERG